MKLECAATRRGASFGLLLGLGIVFIGCATVEPKPLRGPNGRPGYSMKCSGFGRTLQECYEKAGQVCPAGYDVVDRASGMVAVPVNGGVMAAPQHSLVIECK